MANLSTSYAGLKLKNPLIIGSSSLTSNVSNLKKFEDLGASAVILKSIFEEEITNEFKKVIDEVDAKGEIDQHVDYFDKKIKQDNIADYIQLIKDAKKELSIPVIASINCISAHEWTYFVQKVEQAGADAVELNIYYFPVDFELSSDEMEAKYLEIMKKVKATTNIPVIVKMSRYFTNMGAMIKAAAATGINGIALFNRFYKPDIDLKTGALKTASIFSIPQEYVIPLQWIALMNEKVNINMAASTGIHDGAAFVKLLLAGAHANYIVSALFKNGFEVITEILTYLENYLDENGYSSVDEMIGKLNQSAIKNPKYYERAQFMRYFTGGKDVL